MIEFRNINKTYGTGTEAVHNANFKIEKGEFAFLVGSSGSGKSTLIKLILKEEEPTSGNIIINGKDTTFLKTDKKFSLPLILHPIILRIPIAALGKYA